jgi:histidinol phosphatase-like enzyme
MQKFLFLKHDGVVNKDISYYFCPHVPEDKCFYGKPLTDLFHTCQENFAMDVDLQNRIIVDDKITGIIALESMGIINNYLLVS